MSDTLHCTACGARSTEAIVEYGSYCIRCAGCGDTIVATSFIAVAETGDAFSAFADPGPGKSPIRLLARGPLRQIAPIVSEAAQNGGAVLLVPEAKS